MARQLLRLANVPVAAPSANPFGRLSPTTAEHVQAQLGHRIDAILDGGPCRVGIESTILQIVDNGVTLLRPGGISLEEIESLIGNVNHPVSTVSESPIAPGMLASHYAPRTPLTIVDQVPSSVDSDRMGLLVLRNEPTSPQFAKLQFAQIEELSPKGDLVIAAANFFQALHRLDAAGLDEIIAVRFPESGLGRALNDRLKRAEHRRYKHGSN